MEAISRLRPLQRPLAKPQPGDWLYHYHEPGQTFAEYLACCPVLPQGKRRVIYIQPLGEFTPAQRRIVAPTADFLARSFCLPTRLEDVLLLSIVPPRAQRAHPAWDVKQVLTGYILDEVLKPRLHADAVA